VGWTLLAVLIGYSSNYLASCLCPLHLSGTSRWVAALPGSEFNLNYGLASVLGIVIGDLMP
jgi:hypothetical protein